MKFSAKFRFNRQRSSLALSLTLTLLCAQIWAAPQATQAGTAAVAMPDRFAAQATAKILRRGGNAVDAAITAAFVLAVTLPEAGNIGGGGFMLSHVNGEDAFLDFRERAPSQAHRDMYLDEGGNFIQQDSLLGGKASGVPGTVRGMHLAHQRYGTLPWASLLHPAIALALDGFVVPPELAHYAAEKLSKPRGKPILPTIFPPCVPTKYLSRQSWRQPCSALQRTRTTSTAA